MLGFARQHLRSVTWGAAALLLGLTALVFPSGAPAGLAALALVALLGAALTQLRPVLAERRELPPLAQDLLITLMIGTASALLFESSWNTPGYRIYDWGPHHAALRHLVDGLRAGHVPAWVHGVSTGDSPFELYAFLPYYLAAKAAILTDSTDLTLVMVRSAIIIHSLSALGAGLLARRVVRWPFGIAVGLVALADVGSVWGGGIEGIFSMGVTHSALTHALWPFVLLAIIGALHRPAPWRSALIWGLVAFAVACHPLGIVSALGTIAALLMVALVARDVPPKRAWSAALHVAIGLLLVAASWMPFGQRVLLYGVHYGIAPQLAWEQLAHILSQPVPEATLAPFVYAGYIGVVVGVISRRAAPALLACFAAVIMAGLMDQLYTLLNLAPSLETARFQMVRLPAAAKSSLYVCAAYLVDTALARVRGEEGRRGTVAVGALLAVGVAGLIRGAAPYMDKLSADVRWMAHREVPDSEGLEALATWAREQNAGLRPDQYGRLLDEDERRTFLVYHVHAKSGLPALWLGSAVPVFFLRERMLDATPSSLRRFNVRWVMRADRPPSLGDPASQLRFGRYFVRELPGWDGRFARIERGSGEASVTHLENERIDVELSGTNEPALVALGMGFYPRWQAFHAERGPLPVYALPATPGAPTHVLAAWLPPGKTSFRPSGPLPSDGQGRAFSALAALLALTSIGWGRWPGLRERVLPRATRYREWLSMHRGSVGAGAAGALLLALLVASIVSSRRPTSALRLGAGLWGGARVHARRPGGPWSPCNYSLLRGGYLCPGKVLVQDTLTGLLNDAPPSLSFTVPAIHVAPSAHALEVRVRLTARLAGEYWAGTSGGRVRLSLDGEPDLVLTEDQQSYFGETGATSREVTLVAAAPTKRALQIAFVRRDRLDPERGYTPAPETSPW